MIKYIFIYFVFITATSCISKTNLEYKKISQEKIVIDESGSLDLSNQRARIGDRYFIKSVFESVFGSKCDYNIFHRITNQMDYFGGGCDPYENSYNQNNEIEFKDSTCTGINNDQIGIGNTTPIREGYRIGLCEILVESELCLANALKKIHGVYNENGKMLSPTSDTLIQVFKLFYPFKNYSESTNKNLQKIVTSVSDTPLQNQWKVVLMSVCISPWWQIP